MSQRPRRILHVVRRFEPLPGGMERYVGDLARAQAERGDAVTVATLDRDVLGVMPGRLSQEATERGVRIIRLPGAGSGRFGVTFRPDRLLRLLQRSDIAHVHDMRFMLGTVSVANRIRGRPTYLHTHGLIYGTRRYWRLKQLLSRLYYEPLALATGAHLVASSRADLERVRAHLPRLAPRTSVVENAVDLGPFLTLRRTPVPGRIVVIGRVTAIKGIDALLRALPGVDAPWTLGIHGAGEAAEPDRLLSMARAIGIADRVEFTGPYTTADEPELLRTASLAIFPSTSEAMGMALVDAMAAGVPVIASDIPAHREVLEASAPESLVSFREPGQVAASIQQRLTTPDFETAALSERLRVRARRFDVSRLVSELDDLYRLVGR